MGISGLLLCIAIIADDDPATIVAHVNGTAITKGDVEFSATQQGISPSERPEAEPKLIERLIDRQLIRDVLATRKIEPVGDELELQIGKVELAIKNRGEDPKQFLKKLGYSQERLKNELGLALAWQAHIRKVITPAQSKNYFDQHRSEFDGTQVRARQIFLKLPKPANDSETSERRKRLALIRQNIVDQKLTFDINH